MPPGRKRKKAPSKYSAEAETRAILTNASSVRLETDCADAVVQQEGEKVAQEPLVAEEPRKLAKLSHRDETKLTPRQAVNASRWIKKFRELKTYKAKHGDCLVPRNQANMPLGNWVNNQRTQYFLKMNGLPSSMTEDRINKLEAIEGWVWSPCGKSAATAATAVVANSNVAEVGKEITNFASVSHINEAGVDNIAGDKEDKSQFVEAVESTMFLWLKQFADIFVAAVCLVVICDTIYGFYVRCKND